jgi:hypothetical protein
MAPAKRGANSVFLMVEIASFARGAKRERECRETAREPKARERTPQAADAREAAPARRWVRGANAILIQRPGPISRPDFPVLRWV